MLTKAQQNTIFSDLMERSGVSTKKNDLRKSLIRTKEQLSIIAKTTLSSALMASPSLKKKVLLRIKNNSAIQLMDEIAKQQTTKSNQKTDYLALLFNNKQGHGAFQLFSEYQRFFSTDNALPVDRANDQDIVNQIHQLAKLGQGKDRLSVALREDILSSVSKNEQGELTKHLRNVFNNSEQLLRLLKPNNKELWLFSERVLLSLGTNLPLILGEISSFKEQKKAWEDLVVHSFESTAIHYKQAHAKLLLVNETNKIIKKSIEHRLTLADLTPYKVLLAKLNQLTRQEGFDGMYDLKQLTLTLFKKTSDFMSLTRNPEQKNKTLNFINPQGKKVYVTQFHQLEVLGLSKETILSFGKQYKRGCDKYCAKKIFKQLFANDNKKNNVGTQQQSLNPDLATFFMNDVLFSIKEQAAFQLKQSGVFSITNLSKITLKDKEELFTKYNIFNTPLDNEDSLIKSASEQVKQQVKENLVTEQLLVKFKG